MWEGRWWNEEKRTLIQYIILIPHRFIHLLFQIHCSLVTCLYFCFILPPPTLIEIDKRFSINRVFGVPLNGMEWNGPRKGTTKFYRITYLEQSWWTTYLNFPTNCAGSNRYDIHIHLWWVSPIKYWLIILREMFEHSVE